MSTEEKFGKDGIKKNELKKEELKQNGGSSIVMWLLFTVIAVIMVITTLGSAGVSSDAADETSPSQVSAVALPLDSAATVAPDRDAVPVASLSSDPMPSQGQTIGYDERRALSLLPTLKVSSGRKVVPVSDNEISTDSPAVPTQSADNSAEIDSNGDSFEFPPEGSFSYDSDCSGCGSEAEASGSIVTQYGQDCNDCGGSAIYSSPADCFGCEAPPCSDYPCPCPPAPPVTYLCHDCGCSPCRCQTATLQCPPVQYSGCYQPQYCEKEPPCQPCPVLSAIGEGLCALGEAIDNFFFGQPCEEPNYCQPPAVQQCSQIPPVIYYDPNDGCFYDSP